MKSSGSRSAANMSLSNRNKRSHASNQDDIEGGVIEKSMEQDRDKKIDMLANSVTAIKNLSKTLGGQIQSEEGVRASLSSGFDNAKGMLQETLGNMDQMMGQAGDSLCFYVCLFTTIMIVILVIFT